MCKWANSQPWTCPNHERDCSSLHKKSSLKKSGVSKTLSLLCKKERCEWFTGNSSKLLAKNERFAQKFVFFIRFWQSLSSLFDHLLFFKEQLERFAPVALYKRATGGIHSFLQANCSFTLVLTKNEQIAWKIWWANSQPWTSPSVSNQPLITIWGPLLVSFHKTLRDSVAIYALWTLALRCHTVYSVRDNSGEVLLQ